jgi:hypothetical protein
MDRVTCDAAPSVPGVPPEQVAARPPTVHVVRTPRGWTVLRPGASTGWVGASATDPVDAEPLTLVEAMSLADLVTAEFGVTPEPDRAARRAARSATVPAPGDDTPEADPRDEEIAALRRTVGQLEHALAARVSIERAIGVLAERHATTPREAFEELRSRARSQGRPAQELAVEVLDALPARGSPPALAPDPTPLPTPEPRPAANGASPARRVQRHPRRTAGDGDAVPEVRR